jgi:hypothetical protein
VRLAPHHEESCPLHLASAYENITGELIGMDRVQESEVMTRRDPGGSIRPSAQNMETTRDERQAAISRQQVSNFTKIVRQEGDIHGEDRQWKRVSRPAHFRVSLNLVDYRGI